MCLYTVLVQHLRTERGEVFHECLGRNVIERQISLDTKNKMYFVIIFHVQTSLSLLHLIQFEQRKNLIDFQDN